MHGKEIDMAKKDIRAALLAGILHMERQKQDAKTIGDITGHKQSCQVAARLRNRLARLDCETKPEPRYKIIKAGWIVVDTQKSSDYVEGRFSREETAQEFCRICEGVWEDHKKGVLK